MSIKLFIIFIVFIYSSRGFTHKQLLPKRSIVDNEINENIDSNLHNSHQSRVNINTKSGEIKAFPGETIELECEASGTPQPVIQFYDHASMLSKNEIFSNDILDSSYSALINAKGKLRFVAKKSEVIFCKATSGSKTAHAAIKIFVSASKLNFLSNEVFDYDIQEVSTINKSPIITFFDTVYLELIGNNVILPCASSGARDDETIWLNVNEEVIKYGLEGDKYTLMPFGHLKIKNIEWSDMGTYTCIVRNSFGKDSITTFLYPMMVSSFRGLK